MRPCSHVKAIIDPEGAVLLDLKRGKYFSMNEVAAEIWRGLEAGRSLDEIQESICAAYDVDLPTARAHTARFLTSLERDGLVEGPRS